MTRDEMTLWANNLIGDLIADQGDRTDGELAEQMLVATAHFLVVGTYFAREHGLDAEVVLAEAMAAAEQLHQQALNAIEQGEQQPN